MGAFNISKLYSQRKKILENADEIVDQCNYAIDSFPNDESLHSFRLYVYGVLGNRNLAFESFNKMRNVINTKNHATTEVASEIEQWFELFMDEIFYMHKDIVSSFEWNYKIVNNSYLKIREAIIRTLSAFKYHPDLKMVYTELCNYLVKNQLFFDDNHTSVEVGEAVVTLYYRLNEYKLLMEFVDNSKKKTSAYLEFYLRSFIKHANNVDHTIITPESEDIIVNLWDELADLYMHEPENHDMVKTSGRLFYVMQFYLKYHQMDGTRKVFSQILLPLLFVNNLISETKEILTCDLLDPLFRLEVPHISMYMSKNKFKRVFSVNLPDNPDHQLKWKLTCADHMNDRLEGRIFYDYLAECGQNMFTQMVGSFGIQNNTERAKVFLGSFSCSKDDADLEKYYGFDSKLGAGVCVEVGVDSFDNQIEDEVLDDEYSWLCPLYKIVYADSIDDILDEKVKRRIISISKQLNIIKCFLNDTHFNNSNMQKELLMSIFKMFQEIAYLFKARSGSDDQGVIRRWENEKELRTMKCIRGESKFIEESIKEDANGRAYRSYISSKRITILDISGKCDPNDLIDYRAHIKAIYTKAGAVTDLHFS